MWLKCLKIRKSHQKRRRIGWGAARVIYLRYVCVYTYMKTIIHTCMHKLVYFWSAKDRLSLANYQRKCMFCMYGCKYLRQLMRSKNLRTKKEAELGPSHIHTYIHTCMCTLRPQLIRSSNLSKLRKKAELGLSHIHTYIHVYIQPQLMRTSNLSKLRKKAELGLSHKLTKAHLPKFPQLEEELNRE